jgi:hypothetical protein
MGLKYAGEESLISQLSKHLWRAAPFVFSDYYVLHVGGGGGGGGGGARGFV